MQRYNQIHTNTHLDEMTRMSGSERINGVARSRINPFGFTYLLQQTSTLTNVSTYPSLKLSGKLRDQLVYRLIQTTLERGEPIVGSIFQTVLQIDIHKQE